jgi:hypothetical protein
MGYEQDFKYKDALKSLFDAARSVSENVFTNDRPEAVARQMNDFIVVSLPGLLSSMTYDSGFGNIRTYCTIEVVRPYSPLVSIRLYFLMGISLPLS